MSHHGPDPALSALLAAVLLLPFSFGAATAAEPAGWVPIGPPGPAAVESVAFDPQRPRVAFAAIAGGGIARSEDGGSTWRSSSAGLTDPNVTGLVVHPLSSRLIYGSNASNRLVRSLDGGQSWAELPVPGFTFRVFAPAPTDPSLVYAGSDAGLFVSHDSGDSWRRIAGGGLPHGFGVAALAVDATDPRLLYAGIIDYHHFGLWASQDSGQTWQRRLRTVPDLLVCDPLRAGTVYLLEFGLLQRSRDEGVTWEAYFTAGSAKVLAFDPRHPWIAYAGTYGRLASGEQEAALFKTTDDGGHWQPLTNGLPSSLLGAVAVSAAGVLLAADGFDVVLYRSADAGASWSVAGTGLVNAHVLALAFGDPGMLFAADRATVSRTRDGGATWSAVLTAKAGLTALAAGPSQPGTVYAGTFNPPGVDPTILWKTTDGGDTWTPLSYPQPAADPYSGIHVSDLAVDAADSQLVYLAAQTALVGAPGGQGVYRSADGGATWSKTTLPAYDFRGLAVAAGRPGTVWAVWQGAAYKSTDGGQTWSSMLTAPQGIYLHAVAMAPSDPDVVWVVAATVLYRSADGGATWRQLPGPVPPTSFDFDFFSHSLAVDPADPSALYVGGLSGVSRFTLAGGWQQVDTGLYASDVLCLGFDPADPNRLLAGTNGAGVFELQLTPAP